MKLWCSAALLATALFSAQTGFSQDVPVVEQVESGESSAPNIVLILVDDLGFSDLSFYGGEISTPTLEDLAHSGFIFSNYHTAASCAPSRGMLLTGVDSHRNGVPNIVEAIPPEQRRYSNYQGALGHNVVTVASVLQGEGYHTYMTGKWHLGTGPGQLPGSRGFERAVSMADTGSDNWEQKPYMPIYEKANWYEDGEELQLPDDYYSSRYLVDRTIEFIDSNRTSGRPFFSYIPFLAVHIPVQAPREYTERYLGVYDQGWEALREQRKQRAVELGIVPADTQMAKIASTVDWDSLSPKQKRYNAKRMAVYAGMVEAMDHHIGRLVKYLKEQDLYDNTVFVVTSDNGSEPSGGEEVNGTLNRLALSRQGYENSYETLGERGSFSNIGPSFASAAAAPLAYYKFSSGEGGMRVPLLVSGPALQRRPGMSPAFTYVTDLAPTLLDIAGAAKPGERFGGRRVEPMTGGSLLPLLQGESERVHLPDHVTGYELGGSAALFQGDYKLVLNREWPGDNQWHLYNIAIDPGESRDLSEQMPRKYETMLALYRNYAQDNGVLPVAESYRQVSQVIVDGLRDRFSPTLLWLLVWGVSLMPFYLFYLYHRNAI